jgi:amino acid permease
METSKILIGYAVYLPTALFLTYYVSKTLFKNSKIYMLDIFKGREEIAQATNKLFETGFYLLNIGFALLILELHLSQDSYQVLVENLSYKIGGFSIYLGIMLFLNLYFFFKGKRKSAENTRKVNDVLNQI